MIARWIFLFGLIFLFLSLALLAIFYLFPQGFWSPAAVLLTPLNPRLSGGGSPCLPISDLAIDKYWPNQVDLNTSDTIRVQLIRSQNGAFSIATSTTGNHRADEEQPNLYTQFTFGTPVPSCSDGSIPQAFGPTNELFATAHLAATTFNIQAIGPEEKPLDAVGGVEWDWNISPKTLGPQLINVDIDLLWKSKMNGQVVQELQIWQSHFAIKVVQPFFDSSQLTVGALASAFLGVSSIFASLITWGLAQIGKRSDEKRADKKKGANKSSDGTGDGSPVLLELSSASSSAFSTPSKNVTTPSPADREQPSPLPDTDGTPRTRTNLVQTESDLTQPEGITGNPETNDVQLQRSDTSSAPTLLTPLSSPQTQGQSKLVSEGYNASTTSIDSSEGVLEQSTAAPPPPVARRLPVNKRTDPPEAIAIVFSILALLVIAGLILKFQSVTVRPGLPARHIIEELQITAKPTISNINMSTATIPAHVLISNKTIIEIGRTTGLKNCAHDGHSDCQPVVTSSDVKTVATQLRLQIERAIGDELLGQLERARIQVVGTIYFSNETVVSNPEVGAVSKTVLVTMKLRGGFEYVVVADLQSLVQQFLMKRVKEMQPTSILLNSTLRDIRIAIDNPPGEMSIKLEAIGVVQFYFPQTH